MTTIGPRSAVLLAICAFGSAALLMPLSTTALPLTLLVLALWASGTWFGIPAIQAIVAAHSEQLRGTMLAFNSSALNLAGVIGPALMGAIITAAGFAAAYWSAALIAVAAFALAWTVLPRRAAQEPAEPPDAAVAA